MAGRAGEKASRWEERVDESILRGIKKGERVELTHRHGHKHEKRCSKRLFKRFSRPVRAD